jgi:translation initiation factor 1 (eIF-1/SUI1)
MKKHAADLVDTEEKVEAMKAMSEEVRKKQKKKEIEVVEGAEAGAEVVKKKRTPRVTVSRVQRSKRKFLTLVSGLEAYDISSKEACSKFKVIRVGQGSFTFSFFSFLLLLFFFFLLEKVCVRCFCGERLDRH